MAFRARFTTLCCLLFMVLIFCVSGKLMESINVEDIEDPELKERVSQALAAEDSTDKVVSEEGDEESDSGRAPATSEFSKIRGHLCGVFILCEQGLSGYPEARLDQGYNTSFYVSSLFERCNVSLVKGRCRKTGVSSYNHARLWPVFGEEFYEMCSYYERKHACRNGQVVVYRRTISGTAPIYKCKRAYDAHSVQFCMNKYLYYCRWRNPLTVPLPVSTARS